MNIKWEYKTGRDSESDKFCMHYLVDLDTNRILGSVGVPTYADAYSYRAFFDAAMPEEVLDTDQPFIFSDIDSAKAFIVKQLQRAEDYNKAIEVIRKVVG